MIIQKEQKVLFIGDSITDCGRAWPHGEAPEGLGNGYVQFVHALLGSVYPQLGLHIVNNGTSGNTVRNLKERWTADVLDLNPDLLSIMIGTNDVWRQFDSLDRPEIHVLPEEYETTLREIIASAKSSTQLHTLVLMTPFLIETNQADAMKQRMDEYGAMVKKVAQDTGAIFIDTQAAYDAVVKHVEPLSLAGDRIHPSPTGHMVLAHAWLKAVGFEW